MESMQEVDSRKPGRLPGGEIHMDCLKVHKVTDRALGTYAGYQEPGALGGISMESMQEVDSREPGGFLGGKSIWTIACPQGNRQGLGNVCWIPGAWGPGWYIHGEHAGSGFQEAREAFWVEIHVDHSVSTRPPNSGALGMPAR